VVLWQGFHSWVGKASIRHDTTSECDQQDEKDETARSHGLLLLRHNLVVDLLLGGLGNDLQQWG
jgi:hypothetical protein